MESREEREDFDVIIQLLLNFSPADRYDENREASNPEKREASIRLLFADINCLHQMG